MLKYIIILIIICNVHSLSMIHSTATINLCEKLSKDIFIEINERKPFCDDITKQFWLGIAGGPGAGKSTLSQLICSNLNSLGCSTIVLPMDGYHYSRQQLQDISMKGDVTYDELLMRRGAEWTFDAVRFVNDMKKAKENGEALLPVYSRQKSDPVENGVQLLKSHRVIIVEGNYILNFDQERWSDLRNIFDEKWFISCSDLKTQRERLINRHLETWTEEKDRIWGNGIEGGAAKKADSNDVLNMEFVDKFSKKYADRVIINI